MNTEILSIIGIFSIGSVTVGILLGLIHMIFECIKLFHRVERVEERSIRAVYESGSTIRLIDDRLNKLENKGVKE